MFPWCGLNIPSRQNAESDLPSLTGPGGAFAQQRERSPDHIAPVTFPTFGDTSASTHPQHRNVRIRLNT